MEIKLENESLELTINSFGAMRRLTISTLYLLTSGTGKRSSARRTET